MAAGCPQQSCFMSRLPSEPDQDDIALLLNTLPSPSPLVQVQPVTSVLPRRQLFFIWIIHASQGFQTTMLFPMLVFMVDRYGVATPSSESTGRFAGLLASLFPLAQFCTSLLWGTISDRVGRKPLLAFGNGVSAISALLLGLCTSFPAACTVRFVGGLLNGTMTATKSVIGELCDGSNKEKGFGILNLAWGVGSVAGPVVSGLLAQPCIQYGLHRCSPLLARYPFLLPCLAACAFSLVAVFASLSLTETRPSPLTYKPLPSDRPEHLETTSSSLCSAHELTSMEEQGQQQHPHLVPSPASFQPTHYDMSACHNSAPTRHLLPGLLLSVNNKKKKKEKGVYEGHETPPTSECDFHAKVVRGEGRWSREELLFFPTIAPLLRDRDVLLTSFCYSMTGLIFIITDELFPIFGGASKMIGGLGLSSSSLGIILSEGGVVLFLYTLCAYPAVARRMGPLKGFRFGMVAAAPVWIIFPASSLFLHMPTIQWAILLCAMAARGIIACTCFTGVLILVSNSASPGNMGAVTGLSHSLCSFFRAIGPACGGLLWSYASKQSFRFHQFLAWQFVTLLTLFTFALSFFLSPTLVRPKGELISTPPTSSSSKPSTD